MGTHDLRHDLATARADVLARVGAHPLRNHLRIRHEVHQHRIRSLDEAGIVSLDTHPDPKLPTVPTSRLCNASRTDHMPGAKTPGGFVYDGLFPDRWQNLGEFHRTVRTVQ